MFLNELITGNFQDKQKTHTVCNDPDTDSSRTPPMCHTARARLHSLGVKLLFIEWVNSARCEQAAGPWRKKFALKLHHPLKLCAESNRQQRQQHSGGGGGVEAEDSPDEVGAVAAESRLLEEPSDEFVVLHLVDVLLPQRSFAGEAIRYVRGGRLVETSIGHVPPLVLDQRYSLVRSPVRTCLLLLLLLRRKRRAQTRGVEPAESGAAVLTGDTGLTDCVCVCVCVCVYVCVCERVCVRVRVRASLTVHTTEPLHWQLCATRYTC